MQLFTVGVPYMNVRIKIRIELDSITLKH